MSTIQFAKTSDVESDQRIAEALFSIREKDVRSTTLERLRLTWAAHDAVQGLPQPLQLGEGLYFLLDLISLPVAPGDRLLGRIAEEIPDAEGEALLEKTSQEWHRGIPPWMPDGGHECFAWERLLSFGLPGLQEFAEAELARRVAAAEEESHLDFLRGAIRIYQAFRRYARRYAEAAKASGLTEPAENCAAIAERAPETFAQALQLMWLVGRVYCTMGAVNPTLTFGRMDELLLDFYRADRASGRITRDEAGALIEDFYCKNTLILGRGEHQMSGGSAGDTGWLRNLTYDAPQYVVLGGTRGDGSASINELTELFLERIIPGLENPVIMFRYTSDTPDPTWRLVCDKLRQNASMLVYNDQDVIPAMIHAGIEPEDAITYTMHGCNWPDIPGKERPLGGCHLSLPHLVLGAITEGPEPRSMEEVYDRIRASVRAEVETRFRQFRESRQSWTDRGAGGLRIDDCFHDGPVAHARSWRLGSTKYSTLLGNFRFIANATDCLAAVNTLVFTSSKITMGELRQALADDFVGHEPLRQLCLHAPKFGQDDDRADDHGRRLLDILTEEFDRASRLGTPDAVIATRCLTTDMGQIRAGASLGATPDGRHAGEPLSDNISPMPGSCTRGITAMLRSVAKLPFKRITSGALNVRLQRRLVSGPQGLDRLTALLRTYFDLGGL